MVRQALVESSVNDGTGLALYRGAHLCTWVCLPHKMAPGSGNGPWKWLLSCACSSLYRLEFFMWQLGCWDIHPRGCSLIKDSSSGHFCSGSCGHWPPFHPWACSYTTALILGLPVTPDKALGSSHDSSDSWPAWPAPNPSPPVGAVSVRGHMCPPKMALMSLGLWGKNFPSWQCQNIMSEMANLMCHLRAAQLQYYSCGKSLSTTVKLSKPSIISTVVTESRFSDRRHLSRWAFTLSSSKCLSLAAWMDTSRIITLLRHCPPWAISAAISSMLWFILATRQTSLRGAPKGDLRSRLRYLIIDQNTLLWTWGIMVLCLKCKREISIKIPLISFLIKGEKPDSPCCCCWMEVLKPLSCSLSIPWIREKENRNTHRHY